MQTITMQRAKTQLAHLIERACRGEEIVIARGSKAVVRLVPIEGKRVNRKPGSLRGKLHVGPEFFEPLPTEVVRGRRYTPTLNRRPFPFAVPIPQPLLILDVSMAYVDQNGTFR